MKEMKIEYKNIDDVIPYENNPRKNDEAVDYVANSIKEFGFKEDICVLNNKYIITKNGEIYTIFYNKKGIRKQKLRTHTNGYLRATIFGKDMYVHRLVALCFIDNPNNYNEISHEDNNKKNNNINNLKWCSRSYNNKKIFTDRIRTNEEMKEISTKPKYKLRKITDKILIDIKKYLDTGLSDTEISKITNVSRGSIYQIRKGLTYNG